MYYVSIPINMWDSKPSYTVDIDIVTKKPNLSYVSQVYEEEDKCYLDPIKAATAAIAVRKRWIAEDKIKKVTFRVLADTPCTDTITVVSTTLANKLLKWADKEYKHLHKCRTCNAVLARQDFPFKVQQDHLFCSDECAGLDAAELIKRLNDNDESEFIL